MTGMSWVAGSVDELPPAPPSVAASAAATPSPAPPSRRSPRTIEGASTTSCRPTATGSCVARATPTQWELKVCQAGLYADLPNVIDPGDARYGAPAPTHGARRLAMLTGDRSTTCSRPATSRSPPTSTPVAHHTRHARPLLGWIDNLAGPGSVDAMPIRSN
jgi:hypothetical protein